MDSPMTPLPMPLGSGEVKSERGQPEDEASRTCHVLPYERNDTA